MGGGRRVHRESRLHARQLQEELQVSAARTRRGRARSMHCTASRMPRRVACTACATRRSRTRCKRPHNARFCGGLERYGIGQSARIRNDAWLGNCVVASLQCTQPRWRLMLFCPWPAPGAPRTKCNFKFGFCGFKNAEFRNGTTGSSLRLDVHARYAVHAAHSRPHV